MNSTAYFLQALVGLVILLGAVLALVNHQARKRKRDRSFEPNHGKNEVSFPRLRPNIEGVWEDLRRLGLAFFLAAGIGGFLQEQVPLSSAIVAALMAILIWGVGILFGGGQND